MTLDEAWPSYFLFVPCIYNEEGLLKDNGDISNNMSLLNNMGKKQTTWIAILSLSTLHNFLEVCLVIDIMWKKSTTDWTDAIDVEGSNVSRKSTWLKGIEDYWHIALQNPIVGMACFLQTTN
jgi:hypothetical protein